jgi:hypothetical protein
MTRDIFSLALFPALAVFFAAGCSDTLVDVSGADEAGIEASIDGGYGDFFASPYDAADGAVYAGDLRDGDGDVGSEPGADLDAADGRATLPVAWGRKPTGPARRRVDTFYPDRNHAESAITTWLDGRLYVDRSDDGVRNPGVKPIADQWQRTARFVRTEEGDPEWRLTALTPGRISMQARDRQSVYIRHLRIWIDEEPVLEVDDPSAFLRFPDGLPFAAPGSRLRVEAAVGNHDQEWQPAQWAYLHLHGALEPDAVAAGDPRPFARRYRMADDGTHGDRVAEDGIYTLAIEVPGETPLARLLVDVIAAQTLMTEFGDDYNSVAWGVPFRLEK